MTKLEGDLWEAYPNGVIKGISKNSVLYARVLNEIQYTEFTTPKEYLESLGFTRDDSIEIIEHSAIKTIEQLTKNHVFKAKYLYNNSQLSSDIRKICNKKDMKTAQYIESIGYKYEKDITNKSNYDYESLRRIQADFLNTQRDIVRLLNIDRGVLSNIITGKVNEDNSGISWKINTLDDEEIESVLNMIVERKYEQKADSVQINILCDGRGKILLIFQYLEQELIRVMFDEDIPDDLHELLDETKMSFCLPEELAFFNDREYIHILGKRYIEDKKELKSEWNNKIRKKYISLHGISEDKYFNIMNVFGVKNRNNSDEDIIDQLMECADDDGAVVTTNNTVKKIYRHFRHFKFETKSKIYDYERFEDFNDFLEFHDFYLKGHHEMTEDVKQKRRNLVDEKNKKLLAEYIYIPGSDVVSFESKDQIYRSLYQTARNRKMSGVSEYIEYLGFHFESKKTSKTDYLSEIDIFAEIEKAYNDEREMQSITTEQYRRDREYVNRLKEKYNYRCQLCDLKDNFEIVMDEDKGINYVEVHHIIPNSEGEDEEGTLDRPGNMIVLCPNHHRYLHYNKGGKYRLAFVDGILCLRNNTDSVEIKTDKHLLKYNKL